MAYRLIQKFVDVLGDHHVASFTAPFAPLLLQIPWSDNPRAPIRLLTINRGRETLMVADEYYYQFLCEEKLRSYLRKETSREELERDYYKYESRTTAIYNESLQLDFASMEEKILLSFYMKVVETFKLVSSTVYIETLSYDMLLQALGAEHKKMLDAIWEKATHPAFISFEGRRLEYLLRLIKETSTTPNLIRKVKYIYTDYYWTKTDAEILSAIEDIRLNLAQKERELKTIHQIFEVRKSEYENWKKTLTEQEKFIAEFIQMVMLFRDIRKDPIAQIQAVIIEIVTELLKRVDIDQKYGVVLNLAECINGTAYLKSHRDEIVQRADGNCMVTYPDSTFEIEFCDYEKAIEEFHTLTSRLEDSNTNIKGQTASKGRVTGRVQIILDPANHAGFTRGDILVTSMTRPEFVPIMKDAAAVITNEGGITCHAAIVSRELGIPCIIGTKNATRFLKTGDLVEVDADKGMVRILERAQ